MSLLYFLLILTPAVRSQSSFDSVWTDYFRRDGGGWTAGDATISVPLPDGRVIWLFGDSYTVPVNTGNNTLPCLFQVRNCYMVQDSIDRSQFITILDTTQTGVNQTTFKLALNDTTIFWPGAGYVRDDTVFIFLEQYSATNPGLYHGCYIAKLAYPGLQQIGIYPVHDNGPSIFGRAVVVDEPSHKLYIYGNKLNWIVWEPVVARCDIANPLGNWEYFNGTGWTTFPERVQKISTEPVSPGFSVFPHDGKYYLFTQENGYLECGLGRELYSMESLDPTGPFVNKKLLYTEESMFNGHYLLTYNAQAHPWNIENGELLVGYNVNDRVDQTEPYVCPSQCINLFTDRLDADTYRPKFVRIPMDMIVSAGSLKKADFSIRIYPNPVITGQSITLSYTLSSPGTCHLIIQDLPGRILNSYTTEGKNGINTVSLYPPVKPGTYFLELQTKMGKETEILVVGD